MRKTFVTFCLLAGILLSFGNALALTVFSQDFSANTDGWFANKSPVTRVDSGPYGNDYAMISDVAPDYTGAYTRFGGYSNEWETGFKTSMDIYLNPTWTTGSGFDYSVAASKQNGDHLRDFIFHVAKDSSSGYLLVAGSNNSNFETRQDLENMNHVEIASADWYTFEHVFYEKDGILNVDLVLLDKNGHQLFSETRSSASDLINTVVGGNRYGWLTFVEVEGGLGIDNILLERSNPIPEPATMFLLGFGLLGIAGVSRKKK